MTSKSLLPILGVPACILLIPAGAMLFKAEGWAWSPGDFVVAWIAMTAVGFAYRLIARKSVNTAYRLATGIGLGAGFLLLWINGAVGLIGSEENPANLLYGGVLLVGAVGATLARLEPEGMARALGVTALAQFLVPVVALIVWRPDFSPGVAQVFILNFCFVLLFTWSALLFRSAGRPPGGAGAQAPA